MNEQYDSPATQAPMVSGSDMAYEKGRAAMQLGQLRRNRPATAREQLVERIEGLKVSLSQHEAALAVLDSTPDVEKVLNALRNIGL